jgi:hypothetical protein
MIEMDCERNGKWTKRKYYPVSVEKLQQASIRELAYLIVPVNIGEDYEYFDEVKHLLDIPEKPKSIEELSQELDEKFEKLIEKTHLEYRTGHKWLYKLRKYKEFCKRQDADFEHAKKYGSFPISLTVGTLDDSYLVSNGSSVSWGTEFRICNNNKEVGWWEIKPNIKVYLGKKPNPIVRYFTKLLLDFTWKNIGVKND